MHIQLLIGKSAQKRRQFCQRHVNHRVMLISEEMCGSPQAQRAIFDACLKSRTDMVICGEHLSAAERLAFVYAANVAGAHISAVIVDETQLAEPPTEAEGFSEVVRVEERHMCAPLPRLRRTG